MPRRLPWASALGLILISAGCTPKAAPPPSVSSPAADILTAMHKQVHDKPGDPALRLALAGAYLNGGESFAAIEQLEIARSLGLKEKNALLRLSQLYSRLAEPEAAAKTLADVGELNSDVNLALALSQTYLQLGDFQKAAEVLRPWMSRWGALPDPVRQTIVRAFLLAGDVEDAGILLAQKSAKPEWWALTGLHALIMDDTVSAITALRQATAGAPRDAWNAFLLGRAYQAAKQPEKALEVWSAVTGQQDTPPGVYTGAARILAQQGKLDAADRILDGIQGDDRKRPDYWEVAALIAQKRNHPTVAQIARGYEAYNNGDPWQAEAIWRAALPSSQGEFTRQIYMALYNSAARRQDAPAALNYAVEANRLWPRDPYFLKSRAEILLQQNVLPEARKFAEAYQAVAPREQAAASADLLARIALDSGNEALLQQSAHRLQELSPTSANALLYLAEWQGQKPHTPDNLERLRQLYAQAVAADPQNAEAQAHLGITLADLNRPQEAIATLQHALTLSPRALEGAVNAQLATLYRQQGMTAEAQFQAQQFQQRHELKESWPALLKALRQPRPAADYRALGEASLLRRETWIALCAFTRGTRLAPSDPAQWRGLAAVEKRLGHFEEALDAMRRAHRLHNG